MEITEYERLVSSETVALQSKITMAIDAAMNSIQREQSVLMDKIRFDPRKTAIRRKNIKLRLEISNKQGGDENSIATVWPAGVLVAAGSGTFGAGLGAAVAASKKK